MYYTTAKSLGILKNGKIPKNKVNLYIRVLSASESDFAQDAAELVNLLQDADKAEAINSKLLQDLWAGVALTATLLAIGQAKQEKGLAHAEDLHESLTQIREQSQRVSPSYNIVTTFQEAKERHGKGSYTIQMGPYELKGKYESTPFETDYDVKLKVDNTADEETKAQWKPIALKTKELLDPK